MKIFIAIVIVAFIVMLIIRKKQEAMPKSMSGQAPSDPNKAPSYPDKTQSDGLLSRYHLVDKETAFFGTWKEGRLDGTRIAFQSYDDLLSVYAGEFNEDDEQLTDLYMAKVSASQPLPGESSQRLDGFVDAQGRELAARYFLLATGADEYPQLNNARVREALLKLSESVIEVGIFESSGVQLSLDASKATTSTIDSDVKLAVQIYRALAG